MINKQILIAILFKQQRNAFLLAACIVIAGIVCQQKKTLEKVGK